MIKYYVKCSFACNSTRLDHSNNAVSVDNDGGGITLNTKGAVKSHILLCYVEGKLHLALEGLDHRERVLGIGVKRDDSKIVGILFICILHQGELGDTPRAGGIPEVNKYGLLCLESLGESEYLLLELKLALLVLHENGAVNGKIMHYRAESVAYTNEVSVRNYRRRNGNGHLLGN